MRLSLIRIELVASSLLVGVALVWSAARGLDLPTAVRPALFPVAAGMAAGLALAATLPLVTAPWARRVLVLRSLRRTWDSLETGIGPSLTLWEVVVLAVCSGIAEEAFFRGVLQREVGIVAASTVFGLLHPLGFAYMLWAATAGAGLGMLFVTTGSLIAPVAAHATYNLVALAYLRRRGTLSINRGFYGRGI